jgi:hypothetical protein
MNAKATEPIEVGTMRKSQSCASDFPPTNSAGPRLWAGFTDARSVNTAVEVERENDPPRTLCDPHHPA